jgi:hypothetical protein
MSRSADGDASDEGGVRSRTVEPGARPSGRGSAGEVRHPAVAGSFYPADAGRLRSLVDGLLDLRSGRPTGEPPLGILVPHAGLVYSGAVAAAAWRRLAPAEEREGDAGRAVVLLGTVHRAGWLDGIGVWDGGPWATPLGEVPVDRELAEGILALGPPFVRDRAAHLGEHSIEVQLPLLGRAAPGTPIVPLAVAAGTGTIAIDAGARLGAFLAERSARGAGTTIAISTDLAHYPPDRVCRAITGTLLPAIVAVDPETLVQLESAVSRGGGPGVACGMCGIEPATVGLAALRAAGAGPGVVLASATSADAGGGAARTVGYLAVAFA